MFIWYVLRNTENTQRSYIPFLAKSGEIFDQSRLYDYNYIAVMDF